ncbi:MAG TPA: polysaccharide biosynthesis tyrosine autokinase [Candidatus Omnitrophica bacterium]|nr:polysaccharide biosynthesis tyrosine autokinase [Candidatus Omnitrophota bacterium]
MNHRELSLRDYLRIIRKRKFIIISSFIVFIGFSLFYTSGQLPIYEATTTVKIEERKTIAGLLTEWIVYTPGDIMETQVKIIKGFPVLKKVALKLGLVKEEDPVSKIYEVVGRLQSQISTERVGKTNIIKITATSHDPEEAMKLANTVAGVYIEENLYEKNKQARTVRLFIEEQLTTLKERLHRAEEKIKKFSEEEENIQIAEEVQKKLNDLEFQLASLLQKYTEKHPKVIQIKEQIRELREQSKKFSAKALEYARLKREVEVNKKLYAMLREKLEEARITEAEKVPDVSVVDPAVLPKTPISSSERFGVFIGGILGVVVGIILAFIAENLDTSIGTIEDVESIVGLPVLGVVPSIIREVEIKRSFFKKIRDTIFPPKIDESTERYVRLIVCYKPTSSAAESYKSIRTNLKLDSSKKTILITSANPQEGKSALLINLGLAFSEEGRKTLLFASDLRRPVLAKTFGISKKPGVVDVLTGKVKLEEAIKGVSDILLGDMKFEKVVTSPSMRNVWILPCGSIPSNPTVLLSSVMMDELIREVREKFDVILFDSPPVLAVADTSILAPKVDTVVVCYEIGRTSKSALVRAKTQLETVGTHIEGIVLNHIRPQTESLYTYPYYYKYRYYGREEGSELEKS